MFQLMQDQAPGGVSRADLGATSATEAQRYAADLGHRFGLIARIDDRNATVAADCQWQGLHERMAEAERESILDMWANARISADGTVSVATVTVLLTCGGPHVEVTFRDSDDATVEHRWGDERTAAVLPSHIAETMWATLALDYLADFDGAQVTS